jgi:hypothetical protein
MIIPSSKSRAPHDLNVADKQPGPLPSLLCAAFCALFFAACGTANPPPDHAARPVASANSPTSLTPPTSSASSAPKTPTNPAVAASSAPQGNTVEPEEPEPEMPKGFVYIGERPRTQCGNLSVEILVEPNWADITFIRVTRANGTRAYEAHGRDVNYGTKKEPDLARSRLYGEFCGDMTGDSVPEIVFTERTMGAHCCHTRYVVSLTEPPKRLLMWEKGDGGTPVMPVKYTSGSLWQLEDRLVFWPPFNVDNGDPVLSYASAPLVPVVFSLVNGEFVMTSLSFPAAYKKQREELRAECAKIGGTGCDTEIIEWIDALAIGDWATESKNIKDEDLRATLTKLSGPTKIALTRAVGSLKSPVFTNPKP